MFPVKADNKGKALGYISRFFTWAFPFIAVLDFLMRSLAVSMMHKVGAGHETLSDFAPRAVSARLGAGAPLGPDAPEGRW